MTIFYLEKNGLRDDGSLEQEGQHLMSSSFVPVYCIFVERREIKKWGASMQSVSGCVTVCKLVPLSA